MLNLNYEYLKLFQVVMKDSSLKEAAKSLGVTPSAASQSLKKLEEELGVQLFLREHKKLVLTSRGREIKESLSPILLNLEETLSTIITDQLIQTPTGQLVIGAPFELGSTYLVKVFSEFHKKYPQVKAQLKFAPPQKLLELVASGEIDFALSADGVHFKNSGINYSRRKLFNEELALIAPKSWKFKNTFEELVELPHLDYAQDGSAVGMWYKLHFKKEPKNLSIALVAENALSLTEGVKAGLGVAMVPLQRIQDFLDDSVKIIYPTEKKFINPIVLIQHIDRIPTLAEKKFIEFIE